MQNEVEEWSWQYILERAFPWLGLVFAPTSYFFAFGEIVVRAGGLDPVFNSALTVSAITAGFLATAKSIIFSMEKRRIIRVLKETMQYRDLVNYLLNATLLSFLVAVLSAVMLLIDFSSPTMAHLVFFYVWLMFLGAAAGSCFRMILIFGRVLNAPD